MRKISLILFLATLAISCGPTSCKEEDKNTDPSVSILKTEPVEINAGGVLSVLSAASDADGDDITFSYEVSGGTVTGDGTLVFWNMPSTAGSHKITVKADDGKGGKASAEKTITALEPVTQISGIGELVGTGADLKDSKIYLWNVYPTTGNAYKNFPVSGSGTKVAFNLTGFAAGDYYVLLWKDVDNSGSPTMGDLVGWYGDGDYHTPNYFKIQVGEGQTFNCNSIKTFIATQ